MGDRPVLESIADLPRLHDWHWSPDQAEVAAASRRLMAVHAHPDDEASKGAGTVSHYAQEGVRATLVTCTGGEEGEILNKAMAVPEVEANLHRVRMEELAASVEACGYAAAYLLGYRDSGMAGSDANARPDAFSSADFEGAVARLVRVLRAERPHVVLGYDEHRFYPHPDHVMAHKVTMAAFDAAADPSFHASGDLGEPWQPVKLYWFHWSVDRIRSIHDAFERRGWESPFARWMQDIETRRDLAHAVTTRLDITETLGAARAALVAHRTQVDPEGFWLKLPDEAMREIWPFEEYVLVRDLTGRADASGELEDDLFAGV